jgi:hypothetical protein
MYVYTINNRLNTLCIYVFYLTKHHHYQLEEMAIGNFYPSDGNDDVSLDKIYNRQWVTKFTLYVIFTYIYINIYIYIYRNIYICIHIYIYLCFSSRKWREGILIH